MISSDESCSWTDFLQSAPASSVLKTMSSARDCYPFDGTCACSKGADFTLTFDDGSCLKTSKLFLELASPVFKTAIGECQHDEILHLSETSQKTWILILNYLHPAGKSVSFADSIAEYCVRSKVHLTTILRTASVY